MGRALVAGDVYDGTMNKVGVEGDGLSLGIVNL